MPTLSWLTRNQDIRAASAAPYRLLEEVGRYGDGDAANMIIQGDNLEGLKALLPYYAGKVKCVCVDPPYNTGSAFEHYDDNVEHSKWLSLIYPRLELLKALMSDEGSIWIILDDTEVHYLKVIADEIYGRNNYIKSIAWQKRTSPDMRAAISDGHDQILIYAKDKNIFKTKINKIPKTPEQTKQYKNPDNDPRGPWVSSDYTAQGWRPNQMYTITAPSGKTFAPPEGVCWKNTEEVFRELVADNRIWFGKDGNGMPRRKTFLTESEGQTPWTWWPNNEVGHTQESKKEIHSLFGTEDVFATPKPERLIQRVLHIATNPGDLVLDSFLGSGTTAAVAHKMGRHYIGMEIGEHAVSHCVPRLQKVIDGERGGISKAVNWRGGGGFRFYRLGESVFDESGAIRKSVSFASLAAHIWFSETGVPLERKPETPFLGLHENVAYYLLYNGALGDKKPKNGNVLTKSVLQSLTPHDGLKVIYGERTTLSPATLKAAGALFKQTPYDIKGRKEG